MPSEPPVLFSDESLLAVDKPSGHLSIPDRWDPDAPVLSHELSGEWGRLFVVHRIDKDTSGVLVYARNAEAHRALSAAFESRAVAKSYLALVRGLPEWDETSCELRLLPDGDRLHRTIIDARRGKESSTSFKVLARYASSGAFPGAALVEARPATGRTHQIRVHLAALGSPCLCDPLYGDGKPVLLSKLKKKWKGDPFDERPLLARSALHAQSVGLPHPATGQPLQVEAPLHRDMKAAISQLEKL
jgi:tRNA pseudouridine32 synthase / 23S rRNA pseudouridine746 synthase